MSLKMSSSLFLYLARRPGVVCDLSHPGSYRRVTETLAFFFLLSRLILSVDTREVVSAMLSVPWALISLIVWAC